MSGAPRRFYVITLRLVRDLYRNRRLSRSERRHSVWLEQNKRSQILPLRRNTVLTLGPGGTIFGYDASRSGDFPRSSNQRKRARVESPVDREATLPHHEHVLRGCHCLFNQVVTFPPVNLAQEVKL